MVTLSVVAGRLDLATAQQLSFLDHFCRKLFLSKMPNDEDCSIFFMAMVIFIAYLDIMMEEEMMTISTVFGVL